MEVRNSSSSDGPLPSSFTPTAEQHRRLQQQQQQRREFNETQVLTGTSSTQSVGIGSDTSAAAVRLFETGDGEDDMEDGSDEESGEDGRGRVLGVFEVDVSITYLLCTWQD